MTFNIKEDSFYFDERKVFLISGEIHYFRIKRELWDRHLDAAKEAGLTTVSTYVPWAWHEPEEGLFDFDGTTCPERDLKGWLQCCKSHGLNSIVKPGPFILAEFRGAGLPDWFLDKHRDEVKMRNRKGGIVQSDGVSLFNKTFLEKVALWYDMIMPFISKHEISAGGTIIMMQICNEIGVFSWLARQADYGNAVRDHFISYLKRRFGSISEVNSLWGTDYQGFTNVELPPDGILPYTSRADRGRDYEWHCFWRSYYADYLGKLVGMARDRGVTVPMYHNLPGWIYGHGYEFPVNITMYQDMFGSKSDIIFGVDHIPEFMSYRNMHDDRIINDITCAMQGKKPLFAAEFQSGSREYHVVTNPCEMELFYKASISNGLTGWNYYMFSQGRNPSRTGYSGETFYWFNPLTPEGDRTNAFPLVKRMNKIVKTSESIIVNAKRKAEICVLFYPPYYATELERPAGENCDLQFIPSAIRRQAYFDGLLKVLQVLNIDYDMADLTGASVEDLSEYKQVWLFSTDEMNAEDQQKIVGYTMKGGNIIIYPYLPDREMSQNPCTVIRDAFNVSPSVKEIIDSPLLDIFELKDIKCSNPVFVFAEDSLAGAEVIARTLRGSVCGFIKKIGNGTVTHLGTWTGFDTEGQKPVYESILKLSGARLRQATASNDNLSVRERFTSDKTAVLFAGNYYNEEQAGKVTYTHPETGEMITMPYHRNDMLWPPLYGILTPLCLKVSDELKILHSTSDVLGIEEKGDVVEISLYGHRDLEGEMILEGRNAKRVKSAAISGKPVRMIHDKNRLILSYSHEHMKELTLIIKLN